MAGPDAALARSRGYALIGHLFRRGLDADTLEAWRSVPGIGESLPEALDPDEAAAAHERVLSAEVFPYESVFLDGRGLLGGDVAAAAGRTRREAGLGEASGGEPDQVGEELTLLAFLSVAEADAARDGADAPHVAVQQRRALDRHVLRWLPAFVAALEGANLGPLAPDRLTGLYPAAAGLALDLAVAHRVGLGGAQEAWDLPGAPSPDELLGDEGTGLARIAKHLVTPARAGGFLSLGALQRIGRALDLPRGFGKRWQVLESLLHSAAHYDAVPRAVAALDAELAGWDARYAAVAAAGLPLAVAPWRARVAASRELLTRIREAVPAAE